MKPYAVPAALTACVAVSLVMLVLEPVPGGRHYEYALLQALALTAVWGLSAVGPRTFFGKRTLAAVLLCGLALGAVNLAVLRPDPEIVRAYGTVFETLEAGRNPYTSGTIYHEIESVGPVFGDFNYPPLEIYPYYLAYRIAGAWNTTVLTVTLVVIQALCFIILLRMFHGIRPVLFLPFLPLILLGEVKTNVAMTFLVASLIFWLIKKDLETPRPLRGRLIAVLFGLGLMTKFLVLPLMAAYYARTLAAKGRRALGLVGVDVSIALGTAFLVMAPFGVLDVLKSTVLFNVVLDERAVLTTFYPNILSGPLAWLGLQALYPFAAFGVLALAVLVASRLEVFSAMLASSFVFLIVATTPEPQFLPVLVFLVAVAQGMALERDMAAKEGLARPAEAVRGGHPPAPARKAVIAAGLATLCLAVSSAPARAETGPSSIGGPDPGVPFRLVNHPSRAGPSFAGFSLSPPRVPADPPGLLREALRSETVSKPRPKKIRAWIELGAFATIVTLNYWASNSFPEDRDFGLDLDSQMSRVIGLEGWRFDSNQFSLNWSHIMGGAVYYQFGRSNRLSWFYSWMMSLAGSTWWEVIGEPKEVISINDQIMTGLGGFSVGEPWYQIGHFLCHQSSLVLRGLSFLNPVVKLNDWLDRKDPAAKEYAPPGWYEFSLFAGARRLAADGAADTDAYLGLRAGLLSLPEYARPGEVRRAVKDTYYSEISLDYALRGGHAEETRFFSKAVTWGRFAQRIDGRGNGYSLTVGLGSAFELFKKRPLAVYDAQPVPVKTDPGSLHLDEPRNFTDKLAILHVAGPVLDWTVFRRGLKLRTVVEAYGDFALVNSNAVNEFSLSHDVAGLKTIVFYYGYYYGFGGTLRAAARLDYRGLRIHGLVDLGAWGSADRLDRFQEEVTNNAHLSDTRVRSLLGAGWKVPGSPLELFFEIEGVRRRGWLAEVRVDRFESKVYAGLAWHF